MYQNLARKLSYERLDETVVIAIVIKTLRSVPKDLKKRLENIG